MFSGESDDDHEDLFAAADSARNASSMHLGNSVSCLSPVEPALFLYILFSVTHILLVPLGLACSGTFWKKMKYIFSSLSLEDVTYFKQQVVTGMHVSLMILNYLWMRDLQSLFLLSILTLHQLSFSEELEESLSQMFGYEYNLLVLI